MPWDTLKAQAADLQLEGWSDLEKQGALVALHMTPETLDEAIVYFGAQNVSLIAHVHGTPDESGEVQDCKEHDLPDSMRIMIVYGLMKLREHLATRKRNAA